MTDHELIARMLRALEVAAPLIGRAINEGAYDKCVAPRCGEVGLAMVEDAIASCREKHVPPPIVVPPRTSGERLALDTFRTERNLVPMADVVRTTL